MSKQKKTLEWWCSVCFTDHSPPVPQFLFHSPHNTRLNGTLCIQSAVSKGLRPCLEPGCRWLVERDKNELRCARCAEAVDYGKCPRCGVPRLGVEGTP